MSIGPKFQKAKLDIDLSTLGEKVDEEIIISPCWNPSTLKKAIKLNNLLQNLPSRQQLSDSQDYPQAKIADLGPDFNPYRKRLSFADIKSFGQIFHKNKNDKSEETLAMDLIF